MDDLELEFLKRANDWYDSYQDEVSFDPNNPAVAFMYNGYEIWTEALRLYQQFQRGQSLDREVA